LGFSVIFHSPLLLRRAADARFVFGMGVCLGIAARAGLEREVTVDKL
jgi:hypothetical protein